MEQLQKIIVIGFCGAISCVILKKDSPQFALFISVVSCILIFSVVISSLASVITAIKAVFVKTNLEPEIINTVFRICAIGILSEYFCNIIEDSGENAIAKKMELASKIIIFTYTLPLIIKVIDNIWSIF